MTGEDMIARAIAIRQAQGLSVEAMLSDGPFVSHHATIAGRDAYIARCTARGEATRIITPAQQRLDNVIAEERAAARPCPDLLGYLDSLKALSDGEINTALNDLDGDHE
jgi:hypothetical protein